MQCILREISVADHVLKNAEQGVLERIEIAGERTLLLLDFTSEARAQCGGLLHDEAVPFGADFPAAAVGVNEFQ